MKDQDKIDQMTEKEKIAMGLSGDIRVFFKIQEMKKTDTSFTDRGFMNLFPPKYTQDRVREIWFQALALGMNEGIHMAGLPAQKIDLYNNSKSERQKEFLDKFYKLCGEYNCGIAYSPLDGMCVIDLEPPYKF